MFVIFCYKNQLPFNNRQYEKCSATYGPKCYFGKRNVCTGIYQLKLHPRLLLFLIVADNRCGIYMGIIAFHPCIIDCEQSFIFAAFKSLSRKVTPVHKVSSHLL